jgi:nitrogen-specific signal transduction histidine kinase
MNSPSRRLLRDRPYTSPPTGGEKIFAPFFTTKRDGTGLGLSIARKIVDAHGGLIKVENDASEGCFFRIMMPIKKERDDL